MIQGDPGDWAPGSALMSNVYSSSIRTISAASALNGCHDCILPELTLRSAKSGFECYQMETKNCVIVYQIISEICLWMHTSLDVGFSKQMLS